MTNSTTTTQSRIGTRSPWGKVQGATKLAEGIIFVSTAGHGGVKLDRKRNAQVPAGARNKGGWYEEDCEWAIVALVFPSSFSAITKESVVRSCKDFCPDAYTAITGELVNASESCVLRRRNRQHSRVA